MISQLNVGSVILGIAEEVKHPSIVHLLSRECNYKFFDYKETFLV